MGEREKERKRKRGKDSVSEREVSERQNKHLLIEEGGEAKPNLLWLCGRRCTAPPTIGV